MFINGESSLLLQMCTACLQEVASLRRELHTSTCKVTCSPSDEISTSLLQVLRSSCAITDVLLLEQLVSALQEGRTVVSLKFLLERSKGAADRFEVCRSLLAELQRGTIRTILLDGNQVMADISSVEAALFAVTEASGNESMHSKEPPVILILPLFTHPTWALVEVLLRQCRKERLLLPLELLFEAVAALMHKPNAKTQSNVEESDILVAITDALFRSGPPGQRAKLAIEQSGRIVVRPAHEALGTAFNSADCKEDLNCPFPLYCKEAHFSGPDGPAPLSNRDTAQLERAVRDLQPHLELVRTICSTPGIWMKSGLRSIDAAHADAAAMSMRDAPPTVGVVLGLLGILRALSTEVPAMGLPEAFTHEVHGGVLFWAFEYATKGPRSKEEAKGNGLKWDPLDFPSEAFADVIGPPSPTNFQGGFYCSEGGATETSSHGEWDASAMTPILQSESQDAKSPEALIQAAGPRGAAGAKSRQQERQSSLEDLKREAQVMFVQCFKGDLLEHRQLLVSQINNLYKMRNGDKALRYKEAGYEKLHDFLLEIPGLLPQGSGTKMEIKVDDASSFEAFCHEISKGHQVPEFQRPQPVPESVQRRIIEVFRRTGCREIPAKNFRDVWNCIFPHEKLHSKDYGYRDVRGLLGNVPIIEKVGSKHTTGYVLKPEICLEEPPDQGLLGRQGTGVQPVRADIASSALIGGMMSTQPVSPPPASQDSTGSPLPGAVAQGGLPLGARDWPPPALAPQAVQPPRPMQAGPAAQAGPVSVGACAARPLWESMGSSAQNYSVQPRAPAEEPKHPPSAWVSGNQCPQPVRVPLSLPVTLPGEVRDAEKLRHHGKFYGHVPQQQDIAPAKAPAVQEAMPLPWCQGPFLMPEHPPAAAERRDADQPHPMPQRLVHAVPGDEVYRGLDGHAAHVEAEGQRGVSLLQQKRHAPQLLGSSGVMTMPQPGSSASIMEPVSLGAHPPEPDPAPLVPSQASSDSARQVLETSYVSDPHPLTKSVTLSANLLAVGTSMACFSPVQRSKGVPARWGDGSWMGVGTPSAAGDDGSASKMEAVAEESPRAPYASASSDGPVPPSAPPGLSPMPEVPQTAKDESSEQVPPMTAAEHRRLRRQAKASANLTKQAGVFVTSPGAISTEDRDASKCHGKFDMSALYQAQLHSDRPCLIVDFSSGRVLLSNALCNHMFATMCPLSQRDMADLIHEDDRLNFSARAMYVIIGRSIEMEPLTLSFLTAKGVRQAVLSGERVVGTCWCLVISLLDAAASTEAWELPEQDTGAV